MGLTTPPLSPVIPDLLCPGPVEPDLEVKLLLFAATLFKTYHKSKHFLLPPQQSAKPGEF